MCSGFHRLADVCRVDRLPWVCCTETHGNTRFPRALQRCATMSCAQKKRKQTRRYGKVEFCLTKLQAPRANSSLFAARHLNDVLNAFGLFASGAAGRALPPMVQERTLCPNSWSEETGEVKGGLQCRRSCFHSVLVCPGWSP